MTGAILVSCTSSIIFCACTTAIRFSDITQFSNYLVFDRCIFLKFSTHGSDATLAMKPNSFINFFIFLSHLTITANILNYAYDSYGKDSGTRTNFLLYRACSDPDKIFSVPAHKLLYNISTIILYGYDAIIIGGNLYLYRFMVNFSDKREG